MSISRKMQAQAHFDRAKLASDARHRAASRAQLDAALRLMPDMDAARLLEAEAALDRDDARTANAALDARDHYHGRNDDALDSALMRASALMAGGELSLAIKQLHNSAEQYPDDPRAHRMLAHLCLQQQCPNAAAGHLQQVIRLCPRDRLVRRLLASTLEKSKPQAAAEILLGDAELAAEPDSRLRLARIYHHLGRLRDADQMYRDALRQAGHDAQMLLEAGELAAELGESEIAVKRLTQAIKLGPLDKQQTAKAITDLATIHLQLGQTVAAGRWWYRLAQETDSMRGWCGLFLSAVQNGRRNLADRVQRMLKVHASNDERHLLMADLCRHAALGEQLNRIADGTIAHESKRFSPLAILADRAAESLKAHRRSFPDRADTHYHLAVCQHHRDDHAAAAQSVDIALQINPQYRDARTLRASLDSLRTAA